MNIREISDVFKDTADEITAIKSYNFGWASDRVRQGNTEDFQELNEFPRIFFSVPTITGSDQTRKQDTYQVTLFFDDLLGYDNEGDEDPTLQIDKWANLQQYANYFIQRLNKIKQSILPNYLFIPEAPSITFDSFTGIQRMITVQLSFNLVVPTNCDPGVITLVQCIANIVTSSNLTASLKSIIKFAASLEGRATLTADIALVQKVASSLNAFGTLTGDISFVQNMQAALNGTAALSGGINFVQKPEASLNAFGTLVSDLKIAKTFESSLNANGTLVSNATIAKNLASSLTSSNSLAANALVSKLASASLTGAGTTAANLTVTSSATLLLDLYPSAAVAYSLRKLRNAYTGSAIRVRRSSDNTEQDIGFDVNGNLDTVSLLAFCGAGNGFVTTWYDQSGNAQNATMSTQANQPQIVSSGVVVTQNGKPTLQYDGTNDGLNATVTGINNTTALCLFYAYSSNLAAAANTNTATLWLNGDFGITSLRGHFSSTSLLTNEYITLDTRKTSAASGRIGSTTYRRSANTLVVENTFFLTNGTSFQQNNNNINFDVLGETTLSENITPNAYNTSTNLNIGYISFPVYANQKISEFIVYLSNQTTNRSNINGNINTHYAIY